MAVEANLVPGSHALGMPDLREIAFRRAERHSRHVVILRKTLPVLAVLVFAAYFVSSRLSMNVGGLTASVDGIAVSGGNLRMVNPKLKGTDQKNGNYVVGAEYADQDVKNPKIIKLHALKAELLTASGDWSRMNADRGIFDSRIEKLIMLDHITVATSSGINGELKYATLDMKSQTLRSHRPVQFQLTNGNVKANALTFESAKHMLTFRGKVLVHLIKPAKDADASAEAQKPAPPAQQVSGPTPVTTGAQPAGSPATAKPANPL
jgi:lipopolysaccharide export system protein LptC